MMKTTVLLAIWLLLWGAATRAFGLGGDLQQPSLAFPASFPESARSPLLASLQRADSAFLGGHFVNWITTLKYGGDTPALNRFLESLAKCPGVAVSVRFHSEPALADGGWSVVHSATEPTRLTVRINLASSRIRLEDLVIPEVNGPSLGQEERADARRD